MKKKRVHNVEATSSRSIWFENPDSMTSDPKDRPHRLPSSAASGVGRFIVLFIGGWLRAPLECNDYFPRQSFDAAYKTRTGGPSNR